MSQTAVWLLTDVIRRHFARRQEESEAYFNALLFLALWVQLAPFIFLAWWLIISGHRWVPLRGGDKLLAIPYAISVFLILRFVVLPKNAYERFKESWGRRPHGERMRWERVARIAWIVWFALVLGAFWIGAKRNIFPPR